MLGGCAAHRPATETGGPSVSRGSTVVLPFIDMARIFGDRASVRNPVTSKVFFTGQVDEDGAGSMTNALYRIIGQEEGLIWGTYRERSLAPKQVSEHLEQLRTIGRQQGADTVLSGYLYAFRDKTGGSYGVEQPAKVAFELVLIHVDSGRILWQRSFKETQKTLSEDLSQFKTFFKRGGRWISAREMGANALKEMMQSLPPSRSP